MKIRILLIIVFLIPKLFYSQDFTNSWTGHFSYLSIEDISQGENKVFGAAENAIFIYDKQTLEIDKLSTIHGLSGETISAIKYIEEQGILLVGFDNGLMQVYNESDGSFVTVVDIIDKPTIPPNDKRINHFMIYNEIAYISTNYGISLYDINNLEFGDTYFIGDGGAQIKVNQTTIFEDNIYAATAVGISRAVVENTNLIDFNQWTRIFGANWVGIVSIGDKLFASRFDKKLYSVINNIVAVIETYDDIIVDTRANSDRLIITTKEEAYVYNPEDFSLVALATTNEDYEAVFSSASFNSEGELYIGTQVENNASGLFGYGILKTTISDTSTFEEIHPASPLLNRFFQVRTQGGQIWGTHGGHSVTFNPYSGLRRTGISHFIDNDWDNIVYSEFLDVLAKPWAFSYLSINPFNSNDVLLSSSISGVISITEGVPDTWYNAENSTIVPFVGQNHFVFASNYDEEGAYWVLNGRTNNALNRFKDGQWQDFSLESIISPATSNAGFSDLTFTNDEKIFIGSLNYGIIGYDKESGDLKFIEDIELNMPSQKVWAVEVDKQNQVWIGTSSGLRVINNPTEFFDDNAYQPSDIIILDDGIPRELLFQQYITDIEVDGSNNKWISTLDTGVYYLSSDGQETIFHFTKNNSPLPSNDVLDVAIDDTNGVVYFATEKGLVAFSSDTSKPEETLTNAYVYPNPVRPTFNISQDKVKIKGITDNVNIKITDIEGNLVTEAESRTNSKFKGYNLEVDGGTALWNGKNLADRIVASGVYLIMISDLDSFETKVLKVMIVR